MTKLPTGYPGEPTPQPLHLEPKLHKTLNPKPFTGCGAKWSWEESMTAKWTRMPEQRGALNATLQNIKNHVLGFRNPQNTLSTWRPMGLSNYL